MYLADGYTLCMLSVMTVCWAKTKRQARVKQVTATKKDFMHYTVCASFEALKMLSLHAMVLFYATVCTCEDHEYDCVSSNIASGMST